MNIINQFKQTFPNFSLVTYIRQLEDNLDDCKTILDVGCGDISPLRLLRGEYKLTGVDGYKPAIEASRKKGIHNEYKALDIKDLNKYFKNKSFDAVVALDVIEHLKKEEGYKFLNDLERIAKKRVILVTPNGFVDQHNNTNNLQEHLSGWSPNDFEKLGYKVYGIYGAKFLRKEEGSLALEPKAIWGIISEITHYLITKHYPSWSFSQMAIKKIS